jgi:hypothetical protein
MHESRRYHPCDVIHSAVSIDVGNKHADYIVSLRHSMKTLGHFSDECLSSTKKCTGVITRIEKWKKVFERFCDSVFLVLRFSIQS